MLCNYLFTSLMIIIATGVANNAMSVDINKAEMENKVCVSWVNVINSINHYDQIKIQCMSNSDCMGISCIVKNDNMKGTVDAHIEYCDPARPLSLVVVAKLPLMHIECSHTFVQSEMISLSDFCGTDIDFSQNIQVNMQKHKDIVLLGVSFLRDKSGTPINLMQNQVIKLPPCDQDAGNWTHKADAVKRKLNTPVFIDQENESTVVQGTVTSDGKSCDLAALGGCEAGETCEQVATGRSQGICKCLPHYHRDVQEACEADPTVPSSTEKPSAQPQKEANDDSSMDAVAVGVSIFVVAILLTILFISAYKYRWIPRIRARFQRTRPYEEMIIDGDDGLSTNMSNPIV